MKKYKLKADARKFFKKDFSTQVKDLIWWNKNLISEELLDECSMVTVEYGHKRNESYTTLSGWDGNTKEAKFEFTVKVLDMENKDYTGVKVCCVMDEIQKVLDKYFKYHYQAD